MNKYEYELNKYIGKTFEEIEIILGKKYSKKNTGRKYLISKDLFQSHFNDISNVLIKAPTIITTNENVERLQYGISFPAFSMAKLVNEQWDNSTPKKQILGKEFLFFFWRLIEKNVGNNKYLLVKVKSWKFPESDEIELKKVWQRTIDEINQKSFQFPKSTESIVSHVRPHARNSKDYDVSISNYNITKRCFWLNKQYITDKVYLN